MSLPLISIVLCTYNGEAFLRQQLDSLLAQTYPNLEIVVCDDCSTDGTRAILMEYGRDERFRLHFNEQNLGYSKNFEQCAQLATGDYISFCDQDDIWLHDKIEKLYRAIEGYSLVFSDSLLVDKNGKSLGKKLSDIRGLVSFSDTKGFVFYNMVSGHTMLIARAVLQKGLPIPPEEYHDWWFAIIAASLNGGRYLDEVLTHYRQHDKTVTINIVDKKNHSSRERWERWMKFRRDLRWISDIIRVCSNSDRGFHERLLALYKKKEGAFSWPLFFFVLRHQQELFRFRGKSFISNLFEARKIARAEFPAEAPE
jgi:glycosyltransferase involved in cell wall biosynthesis